MLFFTFLKVFHWGQFRVFAGVISPPQPGLMFDTPALEQSYKPPKSQYKLYMRALHC